MKRILKITLLLMICAAVSVSAADVPQVIEGIISWKKAGNEKLLNDEFLMLAGETAVDWFPIAMSRYGYEDDYEKYLAVLKEKVAEKYKRKEKLHATKATEWHRIGLAVLAAGGNPEDFGGINLLKDGTYDRGKTASLGRQGINGWIWSLILLDSMQYPVPEDAYNTREDMINEIISRQREDGGFALSGNVSDPDISAMAVQALAPYYNSDKVYTYDNKSRTVRQVVDETVEALSAMQSAEGDFCSWGIYNAESTAQVLTALCTLGIDPESDERFIKNGNTVIDGIMKYKMADGGFTHSYSDDSRNPEAVPGSSNSIASAQVMCALTAYCRYMNGMSTLYDFRPETAVENTKPESEPEKAEETEQPEEIPQVQETEEKPQNKTVFGEEDMKEYSLLPGELTTENYVTVVSLLDKISQSEDFDGKAEITARLQEAKKSIAEINAEIESINNEIREKLYPFEEISLKDRKAVHELEARIAALSEYDREKIQNVEDVRKAVTQVDSLYRAFVISAVMSGLVVIMCIYVALRIRRRRKQKMQESI